MNNRYKPIAWVAGGLFLVNVVANVVARMAYHHNNGAQSTIGLIGYLIVGLTFVVFSYRWFVRFPATRATGEILLTWALACGSSVLLGPFAGLSYPFAGGAGNFFQGIWIYGAVGLGGAFIGFLVAVALGKDYRAQALERYRTAITTKPRRVVKR